MPTLRYIPPVAAVFGAGRSVIGHVRFPRENIGATLVMEDGERQVIFREVRVSSSRMVPAESMTVLKVRFKFARFSPVANRLLSVIPIPAISGMPGFRQKIWTYCNTTGYSGGIYQFESAQQAEGYRKSPVMRILEKRSAPGSFSYQLFRGTLVEEYMEGIEERGREPSTMLRPGKG